MEMRLNLCAWRQDGQNMGICFQGDVDFFEEIWVIYRNLKNFWSIFLSIQFATIAQIRKSLALNIYHQLVKIKSRILLVNIPTTYICKYSVELNARLNLDFLMLLEEARFNFFI